MAVAVVVVVLVLLGAAAVAMVYRRKNSAHAKLLDNGPTLQMNTMYERPNEDGSGNNDPADDVNGCTDI